MRSGSTNALEISYRTVMFGFFLPEMFRSGTGKIVIQPRLLRSDLLNLPNKYLAAGERRLKLSG